MAKKLNGNIKWVITLLVTLIVLGAGIVASYAVLDRDVEEMKPEVKLNTAHRIKSEERYKRMDEKLDVILKAVSK